MLAEAALLAVLSVERGPGAEACLSEDQLERGVERRLKRRVFVTASEASLRVRVRFALHGDETEARIELSSVDGTDRGTRSLVTTGQCSALDDSLALSVALLVDEPPEPVPPAPAVLERTIVIPPEVAAPREPWHLRFGAAGKAVWGPLPGVRPAVVLALGLVPRGFAPIVLQGQAFWPASAARDEASGARFHLLRAGLALCPQLWARSGAGLNICVGQQLAWLSVEGYGFDHDSKQQRLGYSLTVGGEGRLRLFAPVSLRGYLGGEVPLVRDRFGSGGNDATALFRASPLALAGEIGLEAVLW